MDRCKRVFHWLKETVQDLYCRHVFLVVDVIDGLGDGGGGGEAPLTVVADWVFQLSYHLKERE